MIDGIPDVHVAPHRFAGPWIPVTNVAPLSPHLPLPIEALLLLHVPPVLVDPHLARGVHVLPGLVLDAEDVHGTNLHIHIGEGAIVHLPHVANHSVLWRGEKEPFTFERVVRGGRSNILKKTEPVDPNNVTTRKD